MVRLLWGNRYLVLAVLTLIAFVVWCRSVSRATQPPEACDARVPVVSDMPEHYSRIEYGMTRQEVEAILGPPTMTAQLTDSSISVWKDGRLRCLVDFFGDDTVIFKRLHET